MVELSTLNASVRPGAPYRTEKLNGREYWVVPFVSLVEGVLNGSKGPLFYPADEIAKNPGMWNGTLLTNGHPMKDGRPLSARHHGPEVLDKFGLGYVFNDWTDGKRRGGDAYFDKEWTKQKNPSIASALAANKVIELSTGVRTDDHRGAGKDARGRHYWATARNYTNDHLAVLSDQRGACSIADGCGIGRNAENEGACPECGGEMVEGKCEGCGYTANKSAPDWQAIGDQLSEAGVMPGYGQIFVKGDSAWYVGGDGDEDGFGEKVKLRLADEGFTDVTYEAESFPPKSEGWEKVYPKQSAMNRFLEVLRNALWPGQTRSEITGKIKPVGSGTGDPRIRIPAQAGFHSLVPGQEDIELGDNPGWANDRTVWDKAISIAVEQNRPDDWPYVAAVYKHMGGTVTKTTEIPQMATRAENVQFLTTNCDCWKNKAGVLNDAKLFSDKDLEHLVASNKLTSVVRGKLKADGKPVSELVSLATNAFPPAKEPAEEPPAEDTTKGGAAADVTEPEPEDTTKGAMNFDRLTSNQLDQLSLKMFGVSRADMKAALPHVTRNAAAAKTAIIDQLVAPLAENIKAKRREQFSKLSLNELQDRHQMLVESGILVPHARNTGHPVYGGQLDDQLTDNTDNAGADETFDAVLNIEKK